MVDVVGSLSGGCDPFKAREATAFRNGRGERRVSWLARRAELAVLRPNKKSYERCAGRTGVFHSPVPLRLWPGVLGFHASPTRARLARNRCGFCVYGKLGRVVQHLVVGEALKAAGGAGRGLEGWIWGCEEFRPRWPGATIFAPRCVSPLRGKADDHH